MAEKQTDADKAAAMTEYRAQHNAAVDRIAALRAARLARDAQAPKASVKPAGKTADKSTDKTTKATAKTAAKPRAAAKAAPSADAKPVLVAKRRS